MTQPPPSRIGRPVVHIVDDDPSVRAALADLLDSVGLQVCAFASVREFLHHPMEDAPACLVLDVRMPGQSGMDFHRQMRELGIRIPVVFITGHGDIAMGVAAMKGGAVDFLAKPFRDQDLLDAIHRGLEQDAARRQADTAAAEIRARWLLLSEGEREVVRLVVRGLLNKQIAVRLGVSEITVKVRRGHAMRKMQAGTLVDLVRIMERIET